VKVQNDPESIVALPLADMYIGTIWYIRGQSFGIGEDAFVGLGGTPPLFVIRHTQGINER
jgi:hypothetical protein